MATCPVCKMQTENDNERLCPSCGWEFRYILGGMSPEEEGIYNRKLGISRENWQMLQAFKKQQKQPRSDRPEPPARKKEPESATENTLYSEKTPVPDLTRDPFETVKEFEARISGHKPVPAGKATLIKEKYDIETGVFPLEISWDDWTKNVKGIPGPDSDLHVVAERDLARAIYEAGPEYPLFVRLKAREESVFADAGELSTVKGVFPLNDVLKEPVTGMELIYVPGGTFMMGDTFEDSGGSAVGEVRLDGFYIGKFPVTQGEWKKVTGNNPSNFKKGDEYPVEQVS